MGSGISPSWRLALVDVAPQHAVMHAYEVERDFPNIGRRTMLLNAREIFNQGNTEKLILLAIEDITDRCAAERLAAQLLQQKEMLLQEMQHRVANSLQIIASILLLKARAVQSEETRLHLREAHQRVMSVATVQQQIQASGHGELIEIAPYLSRLCKSSLAASMIGDSRTISLKVEAAPGTAVSGEVVSIGLITTELVINALKHGFPDGNGGGEILVKYGVDESDWRLSVTDNGVGLQQDGGPRGPSGLGTTIVRSPRASQLQGLRRDNPAYHRREQLYRSSTPRNSREAPRHYANGDKTMSLGLILVIVLVIFLLGGFSGRFGGYGYGYGHGGVGLIGTILIIIVILMLLGRL